MRTRKFFTMLMGILLVFPMLLGFAQSAQAADETAAAEDNVTINLHKLVFENEAPKDIVNDGSDAIPDGLKNGKPLSGITFDAYDVTNDFYAWLTNHPGKTAKNAQEEIAEHATMYAKASSLKKTLVTDANGLAAFSLPKKSGVNNAAYLFVERPSDKVQSPADPLVIALPVYKDDAEISAINVYPKNVIKLDGMNFVKVDSDNENTKLAGAEFVFENDQGEFLIQDANGDYEWATDPDPKSVVIKTSDKNGAFSIENLAYGKYSAKEIKAPDGYVQSDQLIPFTVEEGSGSATAPVVKVKNVKKTTPSTTPSTTPHGSTTPGGKNLPKTGEVRTSTLSLIGLLIVAAAVLIYFWRKRALDKK